MWSIFPFCPCRNDILTNRTPSDTELIEGIRYLKMLHSMVNVANIIAIGAKSHETLSNFGVVHKFVRHPANGDVKEYREQIAKLL